MGEINKIDDLTTFKKALEQMVAKSANSWNESLGYSFYNRRLKEYSKEEVAQIINSNSLQA